MAQEYDNQGGLNNPDVNAASQSADIRQTLQNEIDRQNNWTRSKAFASRNAAAWLTPYSGLAQALAVSDTSKNNQYKDLFNMRQELGQANLLNSLRPQNTAGFNQFDPGTAANLQAQYNMNPGKATTAAADLSGSFAKQSQQEQLQEQGDVNRANLQNQALTQNQKDLAAAGIQPGTPEYNAKILGDADLNAYGQRLAMKDVYDSQQAERNAQLEFLKQKGLKEIEADMYKTKAGFDINKDTVKTFGEGVAKDREAADKSQGFIDNSLAILKNHPELTGGTGTGVLTSVQGLLPEGLQSEQTKLVQLLKSNISAITLPSAKSLGANPSDRDVKVIEQAFGGVDTSRETQITQLAGRKAYNSLIQQMDNDLAEAGSDLGRREAIKKYYQENKQELYDQQLNGILGEFGDAGSKILDRLSRGRKEENTSIGGSGQSSTGGSGQWRIIQ